MLSSIKSSSDAARVHKQLSTKLNQLQREVNNSHLGVDYLQQWRNNFLDESSTWSSTFFNRSPRLNGKPISIQQINQVEFLKQAGSNFSGGQSRVGKISRGRGGYRKPYETTMSRGFPSENSPSWKVRCGGADCFISLAMPVRLHARAHNQSVDPQVLQYLHSTGDIKRLDTRSANPVKGVDGLWILKGPDYRPSNLEHKDFLPTYAVVKSGKYYVGFVVAFVGPGAGDLKVEELLKAILTV